MVIKDLLELIHDLYKWIDNYFEPRKSKINPLSELNKEYKWFLVLLTLFFPIQGAIDGYRWSLSKRLFNAEQLIPPSYSKWEVKREIRKLKRKIRRSDHPKLKRILKGYESLEAKSFATKRRQGLQLRYWDRYTYTTTRGEYPIGCVLKMLSTGHYLDFISELVSKAGGLAAWRKSSNLNYADEGLESDYIYVGFHFFMLITLFTGIYFISTIRFNKTNKEAWKINRRILLGYYAVCILFMVYMTIVDYSKIESWPYPKDDADLAKCCCW